MRCIAIIVFFLLFVPVIAQAHISYIEPEVLRRWGDLKEGEDYSFENPFIIPSGRIAGAKAFFAYLHKGDVDVFKYTAAPDETDHIFIVRAYVAACYCYRNFYPACALIGPGLPPPDPDLNLPFEIPEDCENCGIEVSIPKHIPWQERPIRTAPGMDYSWFFPADTDKEIIIVPPRPEGYPPLEPGDFYIVFWNPTGIACDYIANIGLWEDSTYEDDIRSDIVVPLVDSYKTLHRPCREVPVPSE